MLRCPMFFLWHDHPLIEGWLEARLRAELHRQHAPSPKDCPLERFEVPMIEPPPDIAREAIELPPVHALNEATPALDHDRRRG